MKSPTIMEWYLRSVDTRTSVCTEIYSGNCWEKIANLLFGGAVLDTTDDVLVIRRMGDYAVVAKSVTNRKDPN